MKLKANLPFFIATSIVFIGLFFTRELWFPGFVQYLSNRQIKLNLFNTTLGILASIATVLIPLYSVYKAVWGKEKQLTIESIRAMAELKPARVVCLDTGFGGDDALKANAVQIFETQGVVFKTV